MVRAIIEGFGLPLDQPDDVPVLAFVRQISRRERRSRRPRLAMLCLDKRDGRMIMEVDDLNFTYGTFVRTTMEQSSSIITTLRSVKNSGNALRFCE